MVRYLVVVGGGHRQMIHLRMGWSGRWVYSGMIESDLDEHSRCSDFGIDLDFPCFESDPDSMVDQVGPFRHVEVARPGFAYS